MNVAEFDFDLPDELIAQEPPVERGGSRLMVVDRRSGAIDHRVFTELPSLLRPGDLLVVNDTRVFPARLIGVRLPGRGAAECFLVRPAGEPDTWIALVHPGQRLREGSRMVFDGSTGSRSSNSSRSSTLHAEVVGRHFHGRRTVKLWTDDGSPVREAIDAIGHVPLPPYIKRADAISDRDRYQTVYARERGSIAAPTAGLHFTPEILDALSARGVERAHITLHVGYGTFQPIRVERLEEHQMEAEHYEVTAAAAAALTAARRDKRRIIAVGTTTTRTLESLSISADGEVAAGSGESSLFIHPGHSFAGLRPRHQLPPAAIVAADAGIGVRGPRAMLAAYRESGRTPLSLLQLR